MSSCLRSQQILDDQTRVWLPYRLTNDWPGYRTSKNYSIQPEKYLLTYFYYYYLTFKSLNLQYNWFMKCFCDPEIKILFIYCQRISAIGRYKDNFGKRLAIEFINWLHLTPWPKFSPTSIQFTLISWASCTAFFLWTFRNTS